MGCVLIVRMRVSSWFKPMVFMWGILDIRLSDMPHFLPIIIYNGWSVSDGTYCTMSQMSH